MKIPWKTKKTPAKAKKIPKKARKTPKKIKKTPKKTKKLLRALLRFLLYTKRCKGLIEMRYSIKNSRNFSAALKDFHRKKYRQPLNIQSKLHGL